jgi:hypothetical protein
MIKSINLFGAFFLSLSSQNNHITNEEIERQQFEIIYSLWSNIKTAL